jgi:hypothetical protein
MPTADVTLELSGGTGTLRLKLDWVAGNVGSKDMRHRAASIRGSIIDGHTGGGEKGPDSPSRFSLKRNKTKEKE